MAGVGEYKITAMLAFLCLRLILTLAVLQETPAFCLQTWAAGTSIEVSFCFAFIYVLGFIQDWALSLEGRGRASSQFCRKLSPGYRCFHVVLLSCHPHGLLSPSGSCWLQVTNSCFWYGFSAYYGDPFAAFAPCQARSERRGWHKRQLKSKGRAGKMAVC